MTTKTELALLERASVALGAPEYEKKLTALVKASERIEEIKNKDGYQEAHGARMALKHTRVAIQKAGKEAREDAQAFSRAVIAEEKRLVAMIDPEESRLQALQADWDAAREAERQAALKAEQDRIDGLRAGIEAIRARLVTAATLPAEGIGAEIHAVEELDVSEEAFQEFAPAAHKARAETVAALRELHEAAIAREDEARRVEAERIELAKLRAEQEARDAAERQRVAAEQEARDAAERQRVAAEQKAEAERLAAERAEFERQQAAARAEQQRIAEAAEAKRKAEQDKLDAQAAEIRRQQEAMDAERRRQDEERAATERKKAEEARMKEEEAKRAALAAEQAKADKRTVLRRQITAAMERMSEEELKLLLSFAEGMIPEEAAA